MQPMEYDMHIGQAIRQLRLGHGMTQVNLADACGLEQCRISQIERTQWVSRRTLSSMASALGVTPSEIVALAEQNAKEG